MPFYSDYGYHSMVAGASYSPYYSPTSSLSSSYLQLGFNRIPGGQFGSTPTRSTGFTSIGRHYKPMLSPINESSYQTARRTTGLTPVLRINSPKIGHIPTTTSIVTRPRTINTADIDVSSAKFSHSLHTNPPVTKTTPSTKSVERNPECDLSKIDPNQSNSPYMPRCDQNDPPEERSTIKRDRHVVRLSTMRPRSKSRSKSGSKNSKGRQDNQSAHTSDYKSSPSPEKQIKSSWRDKFADDLSDKPKISKKSPGELILEKHIIHDKRRDKLATETKKDITPEIIYLEPISRKSIRRLSLAKCPSFKDICVDISGDLKENDDLNAGDLRRRASLIMEQEQEIITKLCESRRPSAGELLCGAIIEEQIIDDQHHKRRRKSMQLIQATEEEIDGKPLDSIPHNVVIVVEEEEDAKKSPKWNVVVQDVSEDHTIVHTVFKLPKKKTTKLKKEESPINLPSAIKKSDSGVDFWNQIGPRETINLEKRRKNLRELEAKRQGDLNELSETSDPIKDNKLNLNEKIVPAEEVKDSKVVGHKIGKLTDKTKVTKLDKIPEKLDLQKNYKNTRATKLSSETDAKKIVPKESHDGVKKLKLLKQVIIEKEIDLPLISVKPSVSIINQITQTATVSTILETPPKKITKPLNTESTTATTTNKTSSPKKLLTKLDDPATSTEKLSTKLKIKAGPSAKSPETKTTLKPIQTKTIVKPLGNDATDGCNKDKNSIPIVDATINDKLNRDKPSAINDATINETKVISASETTVSGNNEPSNNANENNQQLANECVPNDKSVMQIESSKNEVKSSINMQKSQVDNATGVTDTTNKITNVSRNATTSKKKEKPSKITLDKNIVDHKSKPIVSDGSTKKSTSGSCLSKFETITNLNVLPIVKSLSDSKLRTDDECISGEESEIQSILYSSSSTLDYSGSESGAGSVNDMGLKRRHRKKIKPKVFDPKKVIKLDHKRKCYVLEDSPKYPLIATPRPLQKRWHYFSESETETDSDSDESSDCTDDGLTEFITPGNGLKDMVRMSTCSNDSGFDGGGTAPASPKKMLDCDVNCHKKCEKLTANLCGVNQKLIVEALSSVRRGVHDARDSPSIPPSHNPAYKIDSNHDGDELGGETSYTFAQFQRSGRITAPATTIPQFKKYSVDDFHFLTVLGKGSFGKVLLAELRNTEYYYAVKCLKKDVVLEDDDVECTLIERKVLALGTKHPYLCHLFCTFQTEKYILFKYIRTPCTKILEPSFHFDTQCAKLIDSILTNTQSHLFFVMEYLNGGDLMFHIQVSGRFPEPRAQFYAAEIISGLKFLHKKGIIYRDLKLDNILLDFDGHVRIADFGMCKLQIYLDRTADSFCGTPDYMAPEVIKGQNYNQSVDWWSFGVLLYEMLIGQSPFSGCDEDELFWSICNEIPWYPFYLSKEALDILSKLLEKDSSTRLGSQMSPHGEVQESPFFHEIDWKKLERRMLEPPFKPKVKHPLDTQYFDRAFTRERVRLTPIDKEILQSMDQHQFQGFTYTNPNATPT